MPDTARGLAVVIEGVSADETVPCFPPGEDNLAVDGHRKDKAAGIIGVLADEVHPSGGGRDDFRRGTVALAIIADDSLFKFSHALLHIHRDDSFSIHGRRR